MTAIGFLLFYVVGLIPTYILPYFGSNSYLAAGLAAAVSAATEGVVRSPFGSAFTILHVGALAICIAIAWARGRSNGKSWLVALPVVAAVFDLAPVLNTIPLVPTILHVIALVVGFSEPAVPVSDDKIPDSRLIVLMMAGILISSFVAAGASWANSSYEIVQNSKRIAEKQEQVRQERAAAATKAEEAAAIKRAEAEAARVAKQQAYDEAAGKFKQIEQTEKASYDAREQQLTQFDNNSVQDKLTKFSTLINQGKAAEAAAVLNVPQTQIYAIATDAANTGGIAQTKVSSMNLSPGDFRFTLKTTGYGQNEMPIGYDLKSVNSTLQIGAKFLAYNPSRPGTVSSGPENAACMSFSYIVSVDKDTNLVTGTISGYRMDGFCGKRLW